MECASNKFCRSLNDADRAVLCANCSLRSFKKGQVTYREDLESLTWIYVSGVMITQTDFEDGMLEHGDIPAFFINSPGLVLNAESMFKTEPIKRYQYIRYECLTDAVIGRIPTRVVRDLFMSSPDFARALYQNMAVAAEEACEFAAVLRSANVEQSIRYLLSWSYRKRIVFTHEQMARITGHSRSAVTKTITNIRKRFPEEWQRYLEISDGGN